MFFDLQTDRSDHPRSGLLSDVVNLLCAKVEVCAGLLYHSSPRLSLQSYVVTLIPRPVISVDQAVECSEKLTRKPRVFVSVGL